MSRDPRGASPWEHEAGPAPLGQSRATQPAAPASGGCPSVCPRSPPRTPLSSLSCSHRHGGHDAAERSDVGNREGKACGLARAGCAVWAHVAHAPQWDSERELPRTGFLPKDGQHRRGWRPGENSSRGWLGAGPRQRVVLADASTQTPGREPDPGQPGPALPGSHAPPLPSGLPLVTPESSRSPAASRCGLVAQTQRLRTGCWHRSMPQGVGSGRWAPAAGPPGPAGLSLSSPRGAQPVCPASSPSPGGLSLCTACPAKPVPSKPVWKEGNGERWRVVV